MRDKLGIVYMYKRWREEKVNLEMTKVFFKLWYKIQDRENLNKYLDELEGLIFDRAKQEWGPNAVANFDRENKSVTISDPSKKRTEVLSKDLFRESEE